MRIISKFHDYYDIGLSYGIDENITYVRKTIEICDDLTSLMQQAKDILDKELPFQFKYKSCTLSNIYYVLFCGKLYPCVKLTFEKHNKYTFSYEIINEYCYDINDIRKSLKKYKLNLLKEASKKYRYYTYDESRMFNAKRLTKLFNNFILNEKTIMDLHFELDSPIIVIKRFVEDNKNVCIIKNPELSAIDFYRKVDNFTAFQELSMFIGGVMGGKSPKMIEVSNEDRIAKHGFDKYSFRKDKEK